MLLPRNRKYKDETNRLIVTRWNSLLKPRHEFMFFNAITCVLWIRSLRHVAVIFVWGRNWLKTVPVNWKVFYFQSIFTEIRSSKVGVTRQLIHKLKVGKKNMNRNVLFMAFDKCEQKNPNISTLLVQSFYCNHRKMMISMKWLIFLLKHATKY